MPSRTLSDGEFSVIKQALLDQAPDNLTEEQFNIWFQPRFDGAIAQAEHSSEPVSGGSLRRFLRGAGDILNPVTMVKGAVQAVSHPVETAKGLYEAQMEQFDKAGAAQSPIEAAGYGAAGLFPILGPVAARAGERGASGDLAGAVGEAAGLAAPLGAAGVLRGRVARQASKGRPAILEREAAHQVAQRVLAPGNVAFKGRAEAIAPEMLRRGMKGSRDELAQAADEGMAAAGQQIDDAFTAGGGPQSGVVIDPIVQQLQRTIDRLMLNGEPIAGAEGRVAGLQARIEQIQRTARVQPQPAGVVPAGHVTPAPLRALSVDDLRRLRDEQYRLADEAKAYRRMGNPQLSDEGFAAAETGSAIRQEFGRLSPDLAAANADYAFFKTLGDVLDPAQGRPKLSAPTQGVTGGAVTTGTVAGNMISPKVAFVLGVVRPWIQKMRSEPAWQLADAHTKMRLADAIRKGDVPTAQKVMTRIGGGVVTTSPSVSPRDTAPAR